MIYFSIDQAGFDNKLRCGTINFFDGRVFNTDIKNPVENVSLLVEDELIGSIPIRKERPDLKKVFNQTQLGFSGVVDIPEAYLNKTLLVDAIGKSGDRFRIGEYQLLDVLTPDEKDFRENNKLPSDTLIHLVVHTLDPVDFLEQGKAGVESIKFILDEHNIPITSLKNVLDFGVGCGRIIRWWKDNTADIKFWGTDINPDLVSWCRENLDFGDFSVNSLHPPTSYLNDQFDLLYAFSVFTHLTIETQKQWLDEFARILITGASLLISVHGDLHAKDLPAVTYDLYKKDGYCVVTSNAEGENMCASYQSREFTELLFSRNFRVIGFYSGALHSCGHQDLYFLQKK